MIIPASERRTFGIRGKNISYVILEQGVVMMPRIFLYVNCYGRWNSTMLFANLIVGKADTRFWQDKGFKPLASGTLRCFIIGSPTALSSGVGLRCTGCHFYQFIKQLLLGVVLMCGEFWMPLYGDDLGLIRYFHRFDHTIGCCTNNS